MRALKVSTIVFAIVAIIGIAVIMGRFVFKLGPARIGEEPQMTSIEAEIASTNSVTDQAFDPAQMLPPSPVIEQPNTTIATSSASQEAMASAQASSNCAVSVAKPISISDWNNKGSVSASAEGNDCQSAIIRIEIKSNQGKSLFTMSAPARDFGMSANSNVDNLRNALNNALPNSAVRANAYPKWDNDENKPFGTEFDKATYEKIRAQSAPVICLKLPSAPQTCIAANPETGDIRTFSRG